MSDEKQQPVSGGVIDLERARQILEGEIRRRQECRAGLRPWLIPPNTDPRFSDGIAGSTPEEAEQLANLEESIQRLRDAGEFPIPTSYFRPG